MIDMSEKYDVKECFYCKKPINFAKGRFDNQKCQSTQYYHKKCFKKILEVYAKQGRVEPTQGEIKVSLSEK